ncbi:MAG: flagellar filament capping protein FliD [Acidobacteriota bacterium]
MALGAISFGQGIASGIDFRAIVDAIISAESQPIKKLQARVDSFTKAKNSYSEIDKLLKDFESKLQEIKSGGSFGGKLATLSDKDAPLTVSAGSSAATGVYEIKIEELAQSSRVRSATQSDKDSPLVSDGTITIKSGTKDTITIDVTAANGNNSLQAIADSINGADAGVAANIINDGNGAILVVRAKDSGTANALTITDKTNLNLDDAGNVLQAAKNAKIVVDGVTVTSQTNTVNGAIAGVSLNLTGTTATKFQLTVADDLEASKDSLKSFVDAYNKVNDFFIKNFGSSTEIGASAIASSSIARNLQRQVQSLVTGSVVGVPSGNLSSLSELGITVADRTGKLEFNADQFSKLVDQGRFDEIRAVLVSSGSTSDPSTRYISSSPKTKAGTYAVTVRTAAERAEVEGSTAIGAGGITANETLSISLGTSHVDVALTAGDTAAQIVTKLNTALDNAGLGATAYNDGGKLKLRTDDYGVLQTISVSSNVADAGDGSSTGIGTNALTDTGVDIVGTIGGVEAEGKGNSLIGADGTDADGLIVKVYATAASIAAKSGNFGTVGFSQGSADRFIQAIDRITDPLDGTIKSAKDSYDASIETNKARITAMQDRLTVRQEMLIKQFSAAEQAISQLKAYQTSLQGLK